MTTAATTDHAAVIAALLAVLGAGDLAAVATTVEGARTTAPEIFPAVLRTAAFHVAREPMYYRKLHNAWLRAGRPALKPAARPLRLEVIADGTAQGLTPYVELFCALYGLQADVRFAAYDSVEHAAYTAPSGDGADVTFVLLSDHWLRRWIGVGPVEEERLAEADTVLRGLLAAFCASRTTPIVVATLAPGAWPAPGPAMKSAGLVGHSLARDRLNAVIEGAACNRLLPLDLGLALHRAGGSEAVATVGYLRSRAAFSERGLVAIARELAAGLAQVFGRAHRAVLTDWDNTLWGGEVGEVGSQGVVCGQETPDGLGYYLVQTYLRELKASGIILAAVSRNAPDVARILDENPELALKRGDFACLAIGWGRKSQSVGEVQAQLSFGTDLMLFVDDSAVELVDVLVHHPDIDVVLAGPTPDCTLDRLSSGAYFGLLSMTTEDRERPGRAAALVEQHRQLAGATDIDAFLASLGMRLTVSGMDGANSERVLQLLQKTNQFNLTNRRHTAEDLRRLVGSGARIGVFSYADRFGPQGIIGLIILVDAGAALEIDTWLMSCRVLNRGVEAAMLAWAARVAGSHDLIGRYVVSPKNALVADHYPRLGFEPVAAEGSNLYRLSAADRSRTPQHHLECSDVA